QRRLPRVRPREHARMTLRPPYPRIRKTVKWGGAIVTVLLVALWLGSGWWTVQWSGGSGYTAFTYSGRFHVNHLRPGPKFAEHAGWFVAREPFSMRWPFVWARTKIDWICVIPSGFPRSYLARSPPPSSVSTTSPAAAPGSTTAPSATTTALVSRQQSS